MIILLRELLKAELVKVTEKIVKKSYSFEVEIAPEGYGDFATNVALVGAKYAKKPPMQLAQELKEGLSDSELFESIEVAKPGFINFIMRKSALLKVLSRIIESDNYPLNKIGSEKIQFEYGSANPTGPFTVGHGRQLVIGDVLSNVFRELGYQVTREMYINDAGRQIKLLGRSLWVRYNQLLGEEDLQIPEDGYRGQYLIDIAKKLIQEQKDKYRAKWDDNISHFFEQYAVESILQDMKRDLSELGCSFDVYFSEKSLVEDGTVKQILSILEEKG
ncbi:MAG: arginine--tRNA ligase, partial [Pseudothermotoga sp.]